MMSGTTPARMRALQIDAYGGPEVIVSREIPVLEPGRGEVRVRLAYAGVNFMDVYTRLGRYAGSSATSGHYESGLPLTLGIEGAGCIDAIGANVHGWQVGDRVAYALSRGTYAEYGVVPERLLARVPDALDLKRAAASLFHGVTAHYLADDVGRLSSGMSCLVHAGAGGIGQILIQLAKSAGAQVIATASSAAKRDIARLRGADHVADYVDDHFVDACKASTGGEGVDVVFDSVGIDTFERNLRALRRKGLFVHYGANSGALRPISAMHLADSGSLYFTRPRLADYVADAPTLRRRATRIFDGLVDGSLTVDIDGVVDLDRVVDAHRALETRKAIGKTVLAIDSSIQ